MVDRVGQQLGNYRLIRLLGEGGFSEVYLGEHIHLDTEAAIKVLHTQLTTDDIEQFRNEARTIARLKHHHIVRVLDFGVEGKTPFLVMDYAPKGTLRQRYARGAILPVPTIVAYVKQIAAALQYAHDQKLIHRDIKPENMLLETENDILLSDFGIALMAQSSRYQNTQDVVGTVAYMSPEQIQGKPRPASDQYSLAIVVYEWLSGIRPFHGSFTEMCTQHMFAPPPPLHEKVPTISPDVEQVVMTALSKDPHQRFMSVQAFATALEQASQDMLPTYVKPLPSPQPPISLPPTVLVPFSSLPPTIAISPPRKVSQFGTLLLKYRGHLSEVNAIAWSPEGQRIASAGNDHSIHIWEVGTGRIISKYESHFMKLHALAWSLDGRFLAASSSDSIVTIWDITAGRPTCFYRGHTSIVKDIIWLSDGRHIATYSDDKRVQVWNFTNGNRIQFYSGPLGIKPIALSPDLRHIARLENKKVIQIWDDNVQRNICTYRGHIDSVLAVSWSPNGIWIASVSTDRSVHVWEASTGRGIYTYRGHSKPPKNIIAWSPLSTHIASIDQAPADYYSTVHVWEATTGANSHVYRAHPDWIRTVAWSPDSTRIASASNERMKRISTIHVWQAI